MFNAYSRKAFLARSVGALLAIALFIGVYACQCRSQKPVPGVTEAASTSNSMALYSVNIDCLPVAGTAQ